MHSVCVRCATNKQQQHQQNLKREKCIAMQFIILCKTILLYHVDSDKQSSNTCIAYKCYRKCARTKYSTKGIQKHMQSYWIDWIINWRKRHFIIHACVLFPKRFGGRNKRRISGLWYSFSAITWGMESIFHSKLLFYK